MKSKRVRKAKGIKVYPATYSAPNRQSPNTLNHLFTLPSDSHQKFGLNLIGDQSIISPIRAAKQAKQTAWRLSDGGAGPP